MWAHLNPVRDFLHATYPAVSVIHFLSDGPCTQYKQKGNFLLFSSEAAKRGMKGGTWNFFEANHSKGAPDSVGGALKRAADRLVTNGRDIPNAHELYKAKRCQKMEFIGKVEMSLGKGVCSNIKMIFIQGPS